MSPRFSYVTPWVGNYSIVLLQVDWCSLVCVCVCVCVCKIKSFVLLGGRCRI